MRNKEIYMRRWISLIVVLVVGLPLLAQRTEYPSREDLYVNDLAGVLSSNEEEILRGVVVDAAKSFDISVLTIDTIAQFDSSEPSIETFSTTLFNQWGLGTQAENTGVLIVLAIRNRDVRIELGDGYGRGYDDDMALVIQEYMIPRFREGKYAQGLIDGVAQIHRELTGTLPTGVESAIQSLPTPRPSVVYAPGANITDGLPDGMLPVAVGGAGVAGVAGAVALAWRQYQRNRPRPCPNCKTQMVRLDESADDAYLEKGQIEEERLQSVDYDVWECPSCQTRETYDYSSLFSRYSACPSCNYRTLAKTSTVIHHATTMFSGLRRIELNCRNCSYHDTRQEVIPKLTSSSSSSGSRSSFSSSSSRGSSSGGGASGKW
jgi:uncharacterized protein